MTMVIDIMIAIIIFSSSSELCVAVKRWSICADPKYVHGSGVISISTFNVNGI